MISINLLSSRRKEVLERQALATKYTIFSVAIITLTVVVVGLMMLADQYYIQQLDSTKSQITRVETQLKSYTDVYSRISQLTTQIAAVSALTTSRQFVSQKIDLFIALVESGMLSIQSVGFGGNLSANQLEINGSVDNVGDFVRLNTYMKNFGQEQGLLMVQLISFGRDEAGKYTIKYVLTLPTTRSNTRS